MTFYLVNSGISTTGSLHTIADRVTCAPSVSALIQVRDHVRSSRITIPTSWTALSSDYMTRHGVLVVQIGRGFKDFFHEIERSEV